MWDYAQFNLEDDISAVESVILLLVEVKVTPILIMHSIGIEITLSEWVEAHVRHFPHLRW